MPVSGPPTYDPAMCAQVVELGAEGMSPCEIAAALGVSRAALLDWAGRHGDFAAAIERAKDCEQAWWEKAGREALFASKFNATVWSKSMAARFRDDYTERKELGGAGGQPLSVVISGDDDKL